ncbi:MAG: D-alanine--D-alanine ligase [Gammaproteobacteria bacterium]|nr:D-alanine--D-alanine ligase [Gammaproteobacteria bacterium]
MSNLENHSKQKVRVAVLYGGRSSEHEVSLNSATNVILNLDRSRFDVVPIGIDRSGSWFLGEDILSKKIEGSGRLELQQAIERMLFTPGLIGAQPVRHEATDLVSPVKGGERLFDVVFPVIHGPLCEDGTVQGLLELAEVPYVGCGVLASAVGMDKDVSKRLAMNAGLRVPHYLVVKRGQWNKNAKQFCDLVEAQLTYPVFVKPANTGSSVGVHKVKDSEDLADKIENAFLYDTKVLVEQGIDAMELEVSVLESLDYGMDPIVSVVGEIKPQNGHEFYSYASKYLDDNGAELVIPAKIPAEVQEEIRAVAKTLFAALECEGMARVDLFLEKNTNRIYFNEINTIPGFTKISMYPKLLEASGIDYPQLLTHLIELAIDRHARKTKISREYVD